MQIEDLHQHGRLQTQLPKQSQTLQSHVPYSRLSAEKKVSTASKKKELLAAVREKEALQAKLREISEKNTPAAGTASLYPTQV